MLENFTSISSSHLLKLIQHNTARSSRYIDSCLDTAVKNQIDCIFIQEPYFLDDSYTTTVTYSAYHCMFPRGQATTKIRPRVAVFARKKSRFQFTERTNLNSDTDMIIVNVSGPEIKTFQIINIYNEKSLQLSTSAYTVERALVNYSL
jgi:hypothetical protein